VRVEVAGATVVGAASRVLAVSSPQDGLRPFISYEVQPDGIAYIDLILSGTVSKSGDELLLWLDG
jgi:hypothetical protein